LIENFVCILSFLEFGIVVTVSYVDQGLVPVIELPRLMDLSHPEIHHVEIFIEENLFFITRLNFKVVKALLEVPFRLPHEFQYYDVFEVDYNVWLMRIFRESFVADQNALNRVQVKVSSIT